LDVVGAVAIGSGFAGSVVAPTDGLIVQGNTGIGTSVPSLASRLTVALTSDTNNEVHGVDSLARNGVRVGAIAVGLNAHGSGKTAYGGRFQADGDVDATGDGLKIGVESRVQGQGSFKAGGAFSALDPVVTSSSQVDGVSASANTAGTGSATGLAGSA